jgi:hypothetical protein
MDAKILGNGRVDGLDFHAWTLVEDGTLEAVDGGCKSMVVALPFPTAKYSS